jgi:CBS domain-containing protein
MLRYSMNPPLLLVRDVMTIGVPVCSELEQCGVVESRLARQHSQAEIVVALAFGGIASGWLTCERLSEADPDLAVCEVMEEGFETVPPDIPAEAAAQIMQDRGLEYLFLMHDWPGQLRPAAFVSRAALQQYLAQEPVAQA